MHCYISANSWLVALPLLVASLSSPGPAVADDRLEELAKASAEGQGASAIVRELQGDPSIELLDALGAMKGKSAIAKNWYLSLAQTIADRDPERAHDQLQQFLLRLSEDPTARYWALCFVTRSDPSFRERLLESMLEDPSPEIRYEAVELGMKRVRESEELPSETRKARYQELLAAARLPEQIRSIAKKLEEECDYPVDLLETMGFLSRWKAVGPFDNRDQSGFDVAYPPEVEYLSGPLALDATYTGKKDNLAWRTVTTDADDGAVDLNPLFDNEKGAIAYLLADFVSATGQSAEIRIGTPNACKVWLNGDLVISREVYHAGSQIDQYVAPVHLKEGNNSVLVKLCQNEQTQEWAQDWSFQLRFTDTTGVALKPGE